MAESSDLGIFVGRFHIVLLHLPIGFLLLLGVLELVSLLPGLKNASTSAGYILALAVPASLATAACGWLLAGGGDYDRQLLFWHRWLGVLAAGFCLVTAALYRSGARGGYRASLLGTVAALLGASHFGGSLTHGRDFLTRHAPEPLRRLVAGSPGGSTGGAAAGGSVYVAAVQPILDRACVSCHGADKQKGKLRLDSFSALMKGGDVGPAVQPGRAADSELVKRILLPPGHDDHMPPEGKPQPTAEELTVLKWWVDVGAPADRTVAELNPGPEVRQALEAGTAHGGGAGRVMAPAR